MYQRLLYCALCCTVFLPEPPMVKYTTLQYSIILAHININIRIVCCINTEYSTVLYYIILQFWQLSKFVPWGISHISGLDTYIFDPFIPTRYIYRTEIKPGIMLTPE